MDSLIKKLTGKGIKFSTDLDLSQISYLKTGGNVKIIIYPQNKEQVSESILTLNETNTTYKIIGATSNLLFKDNVNYTCLLSTTELKRMSFDSENNEFIVESGIMLPDFSRFALYHSITGFEGLEGIPGTLGGAVFMNAGAYGYEIKNTLKSIDLVDINGNIVNILSKDLQFENRISALRTGKVKGVVTICYFTAKFSNKNIIESRMEIFHSKRHKYTEYLYPNLGSIFVGSVYRELGKTDKYFWLVSSLFYLFNYKWKIFRRESPINRKWINTIAVNRFKLQYEIQPFSDKTINCLVNRGQGTNEMIRYIDEIKLLTNNNIPIENEIIESF